MTDAEVDKTAEHMTTRRRAAPLWVWLFWGGLLALLVLVGLQLARTQRGPVTEGPAPDFTLTTYDGESYTLSELRGKVVVINFWASWCGPCEVEAADLEEVWRTYNATADDVVFLGIAWSDTRDASLTYLERFDITYPNGPDRGTEISQQYRIRGVPETYIINKQGEVAEAIIGPISGQQQLLAIIERLRSE